MFDVCFTEVNIIECYDYSWVVKAIIIVVFVYIVQRDYDEK